MRNSVLSKILAIVVLYNKEIVESDTLTSLESDLLSNGSQLDVLIYDNSPQPHALPNFKGVNFVSYIWNETNPGVSLAYNEGVKFAQGNNKQWVLLLDQDTKFEAGALDAYVKSLLGDSEIKLFCPLILLENSTIFSPFRKKFKRGVTLKEVKLRAYSLKKYSPVNSGILVEVKAFNDAGGYNEKVKLDFSDLEFIDRFSKKNKSFQVISAVATQDFSNNNADINALIKRFSYFCQGAKNCNKDGFVDEIQYLFVVLIRATMLTIRTKKAIFYTMLYKEYIK